MMKFLSFHRFILILSNISSFTLSTVGMYTESFLLILIIGAIWSICDNYCSVSRAWLLDLMVERQSYAPALSLFSTLSVASGIIIGATLARVSSIIFFTFRTSFLVTILSRFLSLPSIQILPLIFFCLSLGCDDFQCHECLLSLLYIIDICSWEQ